MTRDLGKPSAWGCLQFILCVGAALAVAVVLTKLGVISW